MKWLQALAILGSCATAGMALAVVGNREAGAGLFFGLMFGFGVIGVVEAICAHKS